MGTSVSQSSSATSDSSQNNQGGAAAIGAGASNSSAVSITGSNSTFNLSQESPMAIAAAEAVTIAALQTNYETAAGSLRIAAGLADNALSGIENKSETALQATGNIIIPIVIAVAVTAVIYFLVRKG